jgi:hypothetical protein
MPKIYSEYILTPIMLLQYPFCLNEYPTKNLCRFANLKRAIKNNDFKNVVFKNAIKCLVQS